MTEDEEEALIERLCDEFRASIGAAFNDERKYAFIAGARAALYEVRPLIKKSQTR